MHKTRSVTKLSKLNRGNFQSNVVFLQNSKLINKRSRILEVGSGKGVMAAYLLNQGYKVIGTEVNSDYIKFAKKNFGVNLTRIKNELLPFKNKSFDIVLSFDVFEHIPNTNKHLHEIKRVLKTNGYYLFTTPNKITNIPFEILKEKSLSKYKEYHPSLHTFFSLRKRLKTNGFTCRFTEVSVLTPFFIKKLKKFLGPVSNLLLMVINPDKLPIWLRTNFFVIAASSSARMK